MNYQRPLPLERLAGAILAILIIAGVLWPSDLDADEFPTQFVAQSEAFFMEQAEADRRFFENLRDILFLNQ